MDLRFIYLLAVFLSAFELIYYYEINANKTNFNFFILLSSAFISNFGYAMLVYSNSLEGAIFGNILSYLGSILLIYFMLLIVFEFCKIKFPFIIRFILFIFAILIIVFVATNEHTNLFFINQHIEKLYGLTIITRKNGPLMYVYIAYLGILNITALVAIIISIAKKRRVSKKSMYILLSMLIFGTLTYVIPIMLGICLNFMVYTYVIMGALLIHLSIRANMYDISVNLMNSYKERGGYGYITFDSSKHFLGCDELAYKFFPELLDIPLDAYIPEKYETMIKLLNYDENRWKWDEHLGKNFEFTTNDYSIIATIHSISHKDKHVGYLYELRDNTKEQNYIDGMNLYNQSLSKTIKDKTKKISEIQDSIIKGMALMVESRDNSTGNHISRTSDSVRIFTQAIYEKDEFYWCTSDFCDKVVKAAPMHDLGKIAVDDSILRKPGKYDPNEYEEMKKHPEEGAKIVDVVLRETTDSFFKTVAKNVAHYHHEHWNGKGYPCGLKGEDIPVEARIMALVDVFDALVSKRCYKEAKTFEEAFGIIEAGLGEQFDPILGKIFLECRPKLEEYYNKAFFSE